MSSEERERRKRMVEEAREAQRRKREEAVQRSLDAQAAEEAVLEALGKKDDAEFVREMENILGASLSDVQAAFSSSKDYEIPKDVQDAIDKASREIKRGNRKKAVRIVKNKKSGIKAAHKEAKKSKGCAVIGVGLIGAFGATGWGIVEGISHLVG